MKFHEMKMSGRWQHTVRCISKPEYRYTAYTWYKQNVSFLVVEKLFSQNCSLSALSNHGMHIYEPDEMRYDRKREAWNGKFSRVKSSRVSFWAEAQKVERENLGLSPGA